VPHDQLDQLLRVGRVRGVIAASHRGDVGLGPGLVVDDLDRSADPDPVLCRGIRDRDRDPGIAPQGYADFSYRKKLSRERTSNGSLP